MKTTLESLCQRPDLLTVEFHEQDATVLIQISAHPNDAKIIVGGGGSHLSALATLSRLLFFGSHKLVQIMPIESVEAEEMPYRKFKSKPDWNKDGLILLANSLSNAIFPEAIVEIEVRDENSWASRFLITISPHQNEAAVKRYSSAMAILFVPIGTNAGRMIYASVNIPSSATPQAGRGPRKRNGGEQ